MTDVLRDLVPWVVVASVLGAIYLAGYGMAQRIYQREAIEHGAAHYHPETAEFTWGGVGQ